MSKCICAHVRSRAHSCLLLKKTFGRLHGDGMALRWLLGLLTGLCQSRISTLPFKSAPSLHPCSHFLCQTTDAFLNPTFLCSCFLPFPTRVVFTLNISPYRLSLGAPKSPTLIHKLAHILVLVTKKTGSSR